MEYGVQCCHRLATGGDVYKRARPRPPSHERYCADSPGGPVVKGSSSHREPPYHGSPSAPRPLSSRSPALFSHCLLLPLTLSPQEVHGGGFFVFFSGRARCELCPGDAGLTFVYPGAAEGASSRCGFAPRRARDVTCSRPYFCPSSNLLLVLGDAAGSSLLSFPGLRMPVSKWVRAAT